MMELPALAGNVTLAWNPIADPTITGYNIYFWLRGSNATNRVSIGNATSVTISNLVAGATYCFAATTCDASGLQSPFSGDIAFTMPFPPTVSIVTPVYNQQNINGALAATGKATDNSVVSAVFYALNGSSWTAAATTNHWTNWSANLNLTPGTNLIQAYAVDFYGNCSTTNTVRFVYLVCQPLTVQIVGRGSINPNYTNGTPLAVNENYTVSAYPRSGFAFTNWTDGAGNRLTNRATLCFTMLTNLALRANFVDVTKPTLNIVNPSPYFTKQSTNNTFTVTGKASDNVAVGTVYYQLNGSGWTIATTTNNWTNWTANLTLTPGTNALQAYAMDTSGNVSATNTASVQYVVFQPLNVQVCGLGVPDPKWGGINPNYTNGSLLVINQNYTLSAYARSGFMFTNWTDRTGRVLTNRSALQFTMHTNLALTANFVDITRPTLSIVSPASNLRVSNAVFVVTGKASDNAAVGTVYYSLNGMLWTAATTTNNWTNWMAGVTLLPGTNMVRAYAADTSGNTSHTNSSTINLAVPPPAFATLGPATYGNDRYTFLVSGAVGYKYRVQASTDLVSWVSLQTNITPFTFVETNAGRFNQRFYRSIFNP